MIRFIIDPQYVKQALLTGKCLMVEINNSSHTVTVISRKEYPGMFPK